MLALGDRLEALADRGLQALEERFAGAGGSARLPIWLTADLLAHLMPTLLMP
jgi:hypothetical protein